MTTFLQRTVHYIAGLILYVGDEHFRSAVHDTVRRRVFCLFTNPKEFFMIRIQKFIRRATVRIHHGRLLNTVVIRGDDARLKYDMASAAAVAATFMLGASMDGMIITAFLAGAMYSVNAMCTQRAGVRVRRSKPYLGVLLGAGEMMLTILMCIALAGIFAAPVLVLPL